MAAIWGGYIEGARHALDVRHHISDLIRRGWEIIQDIQELTDESRRLQLTSPDPKDPSWESRVAQATVQAQFFPRYQNRVYRLLQDTSEYVDVAPLLEKLRPTGLSFGEIFQLKYDLALLLEKLSADELRKAT